MAARTRVLRPRSLILSPSKRSIARHILPPRPALKSLSGSGRLAPWAKVSLTLSLWALPTAIIPSQDHTGLPIHFHSSIISRSAARMLLRMLASVLPRQSVSFAISWSIRSDGFIGSLCLEFLIRFHAISFAQPLLMALETICRPLAILVLARPLASHGTPGRHSKTLRRCDTGKQCRSDDHKKRRRRVF